MGNRHSREDLGEPALQVAGFQLWIHGREIADSHDYWDGNWLRVTAHCGASGASVWVQGSILRITEIEGFGEQCRKLRDGQASVAVLAPIEPELHITVEKADEHGHLLARIDITPDLLAQSHRFSFDLDQTHIPQIVTACAAVVAEYPVRGLDGGEAQT